MDFLEYSGLVVCQLAMIYLFIFQKAMWVMGGGDRNCQQFDLLSVSSALPVSVTLFEILWQNVCKDMEGVILTSGDKRNGDQIEVSSLNLECKVPVFQGRVPKLFAWPSCQFWASSFHCNSKQPMTVSKLFPLNLVSCRQITIENTLLLLLRLNVSPSFKHTWYCNGVHIIYIFAICIGSKFWYLSLQDRK